MSPERLARINAMLDNRQIDLTICLENIHKPHNLSAVIRTADAVGIGDVHAIWAADAGRISNHKASGSGQWVDIHKHPSTAEAIANFRAQGMQVVVTNLSATAKDYRQVDYSKPTVLMMGNERDGITAEAVALADHEVVVPMVGMVQSLNVSVAAALILYEAQRQRSEAGMYGSRKIDEQKCQRILFEGGHPIFAQICRQKQMPYPKVNKLGEIEADDAWWQQVQMSKEAWQHLDDE
ncbi:tRNA (guanosine(18)-2'-O)-methyltransferase TrmH [Ferrimonas lipolytica]|uniref:tRNA (guanosine(18)-2'-O)-methyltransferase n=1 Tax=Ferrimonas lipolytica TaxID=2724191 RepID=A0A6H1UKJ0_9GAMM|nr:tRNA (guanosine(18)-2'-O)-methyltransferase TrmH [Ferrimonas lipolytica]QIZ78322.1 tRNA (guanosine(18)-2'-O)-methyltransferase TrmH [Ferrimonas lipolytica]